MIRKALVFALLAASISTAAAAQTLTYADLVNRLIDLEGLAVLPEPGEACAQWSSYNRASRYDAETKKYVEWDRNGDGHGYIRREGDSIVFAEMEGPGCIWRIWSARPMEGHVKIYLDGAAEPAVDLPFSGYFNRKSPPFVYPSLVHEASQGMNSYLPIPYQRSCKIVGGGRWGAFYHITYSTFPEGTKVPTFSTALSAADASALERVDAFLSQRLGTDPAGPREGEVTNAKTVELRPGGTAAVAELEGARAITALKVKLKTAFSREETAAVLREILLRITWDGEKGPGVWAPLGDFFGTTPGINRYKSLPLGMTEDGFYSYWYMPFAKSALVELANEGDSTCSFDVSVTHAAVSRPIAELGRFHAKWHRDALLPVEPERAIDWTMLKTSGRGRFCGVMLHVWNPRGGWWGEGDEKFFVDGEKFPSTYGTGSEDYFGYAWGDPSVFHHAYHNQTFNRARNRGHVSVNRWHIPDSVPFQSSFEAAIEKYHSNERPTLYACTAYWYLAAGSADLYGPVPEAERTGYYDHLFPWSPTTIHPQELHILDVTGGSTRTIQLMRKPEQTRWIYFLWDQAKAGDRLVLETLPLKKSGLYKMDVKLVGGPDFGTVRLHLDGAEIGETINLKRDELKDLDYISFGTFELERGFHLITVEMVDPGQGGGRFGLQSLSLKRCPDQE